MRKGNVKDGILGVDLCKKIFCSTILLLVLNGLHAQQRRDWKTRIDQIVEKADSLSMVVIKNGSYAGYLFTDTTADTRPSTEELLERIIPGTDHPAIFKTIINFVGQGKYLKIINY